MVDPVSSLQTADAAIGIIRLAYQTYKFLEQVSHANAEAGVLKEKTKRLYELVNSVESLLNTREEIRGAITPRPGEKGIEETVRSSLKACRACLNQLRRRLRALTSDQSLTFRATVVESFRFTLSQSERQEQERAIETNIQNLNTSLILLQLLERETTERKLDVLQKSMEEANAHLRSLSQQQLARSPPLNNESLQQLDSAAEEADLLGIKSLQETIKVAKSAHSSYGSDLEPDRRSLLRITDEPDSGSTYSEEYENVLSPEQPLASALLSADLPGSRQVDSISHELAEPLHDLEDSTWQPPELLAECREGFKYAADREYVKGNYALAESYQKKAIDNGIQLEREAHQQFAERQVMHERLVDIFMKQQKFGEAARVLCEELLKSDATLDTADRKKADAQVWMRLAQVHHCMFTAGKDGPDREVAQNHLRISKLYATQKAFSQIHTLEQAGEVTRQDAQFVDCINLCVQILEDHGDHIIALAYRKLYLSNSQPPSSLEVSRTTDQSGSSTNEQHVDEYVRQLGLLGEPGRPRISNAIRYDLRERFQEILADSVANKDEAINERDQIGGMNWTPLMYAVGCGHERSCSCDMAMGKLIDHGADIEATVGSNANIETALHQAVAAGKNRQVQLLLIKGADKNACYPFTPLATAVRKNQNGLVKLLLDQGAEPPVDNNKETLLHHAIASGSFDAFEALLRPEYRDKINADAKGAGGKTPLLLCAYTSDRPKSYAMATELLKRDDVNPDALDSSGRSALHFATKQRWDPKHKERERFVDLLLDNGADPTKTSEKFRGPYFETYPRIRALLYPERELKRKDSTTSGSSFNSRRLSTSTFTSLEPVDSRESRKSRESTKSRLVSLPFSKTRKLSNS